MSKAICHPEREAHANDLCMPCLYASEGKAAEPQVDIFELKVMEEVNKLMVRRVASERLQSLVNAAQWAPNTKHTFSAAEMVGLPPVEWLVPGYIPKHGLTQLTALSKAGKSFVALEWAIQLAQAGKSVLYVVGEGWNGMGARLRAWQFANNGAEVPEGLRFRPPTMTPDLLSESSVEAFIDNVRWDVEDLGYDLIIMDTLARVISGNESDAEIIGKAVQACTRISSELGGAVLLVHHFGWATGRQRGSSALYGACDAVIYMEEANAQDKISRVFVEKMKDGRSGDDFYVQIYAPDPLHPDEGAIRRVDAPNTGMKLLVDIQEYLRDNPDSNGTEIADALGEERSKVSRSLAALELQGLVGSVKGPRNSKLWRAAV